MKPISKTDGYTSIFEDINKAKGTEEQLENQEGLISDLEQELALSMSDEELLSLKSEWERNWNSSAERKKLEEKQKTSEDYWKGKHFTMSNDDRPLMDNIIFEAVETFLPMITRQKPEPIVESNNTIEGNRLADKVQKMLVFQADRERLKLKLQKVARYWAIYYVGIAKLGWDLEEQDIKLQIIRPQKLILDPNASIEECVYKGEYIGERRQEKASVLVKRFPKHKKAIAEEVKGKMGSMVQFVEWWTDEYVFWTMKDIVLLKAKNPHWNYTDETKHTDEYGNETMNVVEGKNHFSVPKKPYVFLSVFNLGKHPFDEVSIIEQNLALQDSINKKCRQIDKNGDNTNAGMLVSGDHFTKEQASQVDGTLRRGGTVWVPSGSVGNAVNRTVAPPLPNYIYQSLVDYRNEVRNIFGTRGTAPQGIISEQTVRGKILVKGQDTDRSSLITEHIEQFVDEIFNWMVQLMYVYYDEAHVASVIGKERAKEYISLQKDDFNTKLMVSVKEGSMIPKDNLTRANQAVELAQAGLIDPITLFEMLEYPNPRETAEKAFLYKNMPDRLFPDLAQKQGVQPQIQGDAQQTSQPVPQESSQPNILNQVPIPQ